MEMNQISTDLRRRIQAQGFHVRDFHLKSGNKSEWVFMIYASTGQPQCMHVSLFEMSYEPATEFQWRIRSATEEYDHLEKSFKRMVMLTKARACRYPWYHSFYKEMNAETA